MSYGDHGYDYDERAPELTERRCPRCECETFDGKACWECGYSAPAPKAAPHVAGIAPDGSWTDPVARVRWTSSELAEISRRRKTGGSQSREKRAIPQWVLDAHAQHERERQAKIDEEAKFWTPPPVRRPLAHEWESVVYQIRSGAAIVDAKRTASDPALWLAGRMKMDSRLIRAAFALHAAGREIDIEQALQAAQP